MRPSPTPPQAITRARLRTVAVTAGHLAPVLPLPQPQATRPRAASADIAAGNLPSPNSAQIWARAARIRGLRRRHALLAAARAYGRPAPATSRWEGEGEGVAALGFPVGNDGSGEREDAREEASPPPSLRPRGLPAVRSGGGEMEERGRRS